MAKKAADDEDSTTRTVYLKGVEMFAEGVWNGNSFSSADLDAMADAFDALGLAGRVPLKLGHEGRDARELDDPVKNPLKQLALGWVMKVYREGKKLLADWEVPVEVHDLIDKGYLRHVSVELLKDVQAGTRVIPWVLDAVALLGSDQPAVGILRDLKKALKMAAEAVSLPSAARIAFSSSRADLRINFTGETKHMSGDALKELADQIAQLRVDMTKKDEQIAAQKTTITSLTDIKTKFTALEQQVHKDKVSSHRKTLVDKLEAAVKAEDIQPKVRANFISVYGVEDDDQVLKVTMEQVNDFIVANPNPFKKKDPTKDKIVALSRATDDVPPGTLPDDEMRLRVEAQLRTDGKLEPTSEDVQRAAVALFRSNPALAERYRMSVMEAVNHPALRQQ